MGDLESISNKLFNNMVDLDTISKQVNNMGDLDTISEQVMHRVG